MACFQCGSEDGTSAQLCPKCVEKNKESHSKPIEEIRKAILKAFNQRQGSRLRYIPDVIQENFGMVLFAVVLLSFAAYLGQSGLPSAADSIKKKLYNVEVAQQGTLQADFKAEPLSGNAPLDVQLTDTSIGPEPATWFWEIVGTSWTSKQQNPKLLLTTENPDGWHLTIRLTITTKHETSTKTKENYIFVVPEGTEIPTATNLAPIIEFNSLSLNEDQIVISGKATSAAEIKRVAYCIERCKQGETLWADGDADWSVSLSPQTFGDSKKIRFIILAETAGGHWSKPLSKIINLETMEIENAPEMAP